MRYPSIKEVQEDYDSSFRYDPNIVCHKCGKRYCIHEIQKFKRHIKEFFLIKNDILFLIDIFAHAHTYNKYI